MWFQNYSFIAKNKNQAYARPLFSPVFSFFLKFLQKKSRKYLYKIKNDYIFAMISEMKY